MVHLQARPRRHTSGEAARSDSVQLTAVVKSRVTAAVEDLRLLYGAVEKPTDNRPSRSFILRGEGCAVGGMCGSAGPIGRSFGESTMPNPTQTEFVATS